MPLVVLARAAVYVLGASVVLCSVLQPHKVFIDPRTLRSPFDVKPPSDVKLR